LVNLHTLIEADIQRLLADAGRPAPRARVDLAHVRDVLWPDRQALTH
jgi:hypothetical protein